jgi:hypothetical protein
MPEQKNPIPPFETVFEPLNESAIRASGFAAEFDGGSFVLRVFEIREDPAARPSLLATKRRNVEIGRFAVSPIALQSLSSALEFARVTYKRAMGHEFPQQEAVLKSLKALALEEQTKASKGS